MPCIDMVSCRGSTHRGGSYGPQYILIIVISSIILGTNSSRIMSTRGDWERSTLQQLTHMQDVSRAWDSLLEAKHVLQRIENKVDIRRRRHPQAQKICRRLQMDGDAFYGLDSCDLSHPETEQIYRTEPGQTFTIHSKEPDGPHTSLSPTMDLPPGFSGRRTLTHSPHRDGPSLFCCNAGGMNTGKYSMDTCRGSKLARDSRDGYRGGQTMDGGHSSEEDVVLERPSMCLPEHHPQDMDEAFIPYPDVTSPLSANHLQSETKHSPLLTPKADLYAQKLESLKSRSPTNKLERLKERIREQKTRQDVLKRNLTRSLQDPGGTRRQAVTRKVCKVTFGPPLPVHKGNIAADKERIPMYLRAVTGITDRGNVKKIDTEKGRRTQTPVFRCSKENAKMKIKSPLSRKPSIKSLLPEKKEGKCGLDLYGASAWREGQKLITQILGPLSVTLMKPRTSATGPESSVKTYQKPGTPSRPPWNRGFAEGVSTKHNTDSAGRKGVRSPCKMLGKDSKKVEDNRSQSLSTKRPHVVLDNPQKRPPGKENVGLGDEEQTRITKVRSYSADEIRNFMKRKHLERQKVERETRRKMYKAVERRREQLHGVLRKQRDAVPPKRGAAQRNPRMQPRVTERLGNVRNDLSEWLHVTSSDLLREEDGSSGEAGTRLPEDLLNTEYSRPLHLRDLAPVLTNQQQDHLMEDTWKDRLCPLSGKQVTEPFSLYRTGQERVQAIWASAKDLGRRVELEVSRLGGVQPSVSSVTPASYGSPSPISSKSGKSPVSAKTKPAQSLAEQRRGANTAPSLEHDDIPPITSVSTDFLQTSDLSRITIGQLKRNVCGLQKEYIEEMSPTRMFQPNTHIGETPKSPFIRRPDSARTQKGSEFSVPRVLKDKKSPSPRRKSASPTNRDKIGKSVPSPHEDSSSPVGYLRQKRMDISNIMKVQIGQQERDLAALRLRAEVEAREAQRCMDELLRCNTQQSLTPPVMAPEMDVRCKTHRRQSERTHINERSEEGGTTQTIPVKAHATINTAPLECDTWDRSEPATDSTSKWSEIAEFYGSPNMFSRLTLEMVQQYLREEELRARHQTALLRLREEALKEKTKAELALLKHQKIYWEMKEDHRTVEDIMRQEEEIQRNLKQEQAEIRHLHNMYQAAHQKRKLLLRQQDDVLRIQRCAAHMQQKLQSSAVTVQVSELIDLELSGNQTRDGTLRISTSSSDQLDQNTQSAVSDLSVDDDITENMEPMSIERVPVTEDNRLSHGPEVHEGPPARQRDPQTSDAAEEELGCLVKEDGAVRDREHWTESPQNILSNPATPSNVRNHSQEKSISAHEDDLGASEETLPQELGKSLSLMAQEKQTDPIKPNHSEDEQQDVDVVTSDKEAAADIRLVLDSDSDHNLPTLSVPSTTNILSQSPGGGAVSLAEFQKASAKLINISESSLSASDRGLDGQDTESGDSEVFDMEFSEFPSGGHINGDWRVHSAKQEDLIHKNEGKQSSRNKENPGAVYTSDERSGGDGYNPTSSSPQAPDSRSPVDLGMEETKSKTAPLASESFPTSEDLTESEHTKHLPENEGSNAVTITDLQKSTSMSPKDVSNAARTSSPDTKDQQRVMETNGKQSVTENVICKKSEMGPFHATSSKDLFQIKSFPHRSEGEIIFITEEVLQPIEDTLSEIFSPVDEKLSYESADLYSTQQDRSEERPSLPKDTDSSNSGDMDTEDFPTPPEEILFSRTESVQSSREASLIEEIHFLYDSLLTEDNLLPPTEFIPQQLYNDGNSGTSPLEMGDTRNSPEVVKQSKPFLTLSKAEEDTHDPLYFFEIGDRVLVKLSKPGTLKFKGLTSFKEGYWAGVALDKAEGDNDGTYEGIKYFECPKNCGVFVRPGQISHLLFDEKDGSDQMGDDHSFDEGPSPRYFRSPDPAGGDRRRQGGNDERKQSSEEDINQSWSRSLQPSDNISNIRVADVSHLISDLSPSCLSNRIQEDTDPGQTLQMKRFGGGGTNRLISTHPQKEKHRLFLTVSDQLICGLLCDVIVTFTKCTNAQGKVPLIITSHDVKEETFNLLTSWSTQDAGTGHVDRIAHTLLTDIITDCIIENKKKKRIQGKENKHRTAKISSSSLLAEGGEMVSSRGGGITLLMDFADELKSSIQLIENINCKKQTYVMCQHPGEKRWL